jgi:hypothetical protein
VAAHPSKETIMFKRFSALFLAALLMSACAGTPKQESTGEYTTTAGSRRR